MNKYIIGSWTLICIVPLLFSSCSKNTDENILPSTAETSWTVGAEISETSEADLKNKGFTENTIVFPSGNDEVTEYNKDILNIEKFSVNVLLPDGWGIKAKNENDKSNVYSSVFSIYYIFDENNNIVGTVGYNIIPTELSENDLIANVIYNQIALGNDYCFDIREKYDVVSSSDTCEIAITDVYYSEVITEGNGVKYNTGILMYDSLCGVYVAFDLDSKALTYAQCIDIAKSIKIC